MALLITLILFFAGILIALISVMIGIGGGLLFVPFLIYVMKFEPSDATLISSFAIFWSSLSAFFKYRSQGKVDIKTAINFIILALIGSVIGGFTAENYVQGNLLKKIFGIFVLASAIRGLVKILFFHEKIDESLIVELDETDPNFRNLIDDEGNEVKYIVKLGIGKYFALLGGFIAGLLGIGGGIVFVPVLNSISGLPIHIAAPTSITMIVVTSFISLTTRLILKTDTGFDYIQYLSLAVPLAAGALIGARLGPNYVKKINSRNLVAFFWFIAFFAGIRMLIV